MAGCPATPPPAPEPPLALFSATPTGGIAPLLVTFADASATGSSDITFRNWDFGDGESSAEQNPVHTYTEPGTYTVTLSVANVAGVNRLTRAAYIAVRAAAGPRANFTADVRAGEGPLTVKFSDASNEGDSEITTWHWDFGDGTTATAAEPEHVYTKLGHFDVSLTVTTALGDNTAVKGSFVTVSGKDLAFGGAGVDRAFALAALDDGRYLLAGDTTDPAGTGRDVYLVTTDTAGNAESEARTTGTGDETATGLLRMRDGGLLVCGTKVNADATSQALVYRTDTGGSRLWTKTLGSATESLGAAAVVQTVDDGAVIVGMRYGNDETDSEAWAARLDADGVLLWSEGFGAGRFTGVTTRGTGFVCCGATAGSEDARVSLVDSEGGLRWDTVFAEMGRQQFNGIAPLPNGGFVLAGQTAPVEGMSNAWLASIDTLGAAGWEYVYPSDGPSRANAIVVRPDGRMIFAGSARASFSALDDALLASVSAAGTLQWATRFGGDKTDRAFALVAEDDGGYTLAGTTESFGTIGTNMFLVKTNANGVQQRFPIAGR